MKKIILVLLALIPFKNTDAQWTLNFQTMHQQIAAVLSSPDDSICWFITNMDSLYKTSNGGQTWTKLPPSATSFFPSGLFVLNNDTAFKWGNGALYKTMDGGLSWSPVFSGAVSQPPVMWMKDDMEGVLSYNGQLYKSTDGGNTWSTTGITQPPVTTINSSGKGTVYSIGNQLWVALAGNGIAYSPDFGTTWNLPSNTGLSFSSPANISFGSPELGLAIRSSSPFVYLTTDSGNTWTMADNSLGSNQDVLVKGSRLWYIPNPADHFYIRYSADTGATWIQQLTDPDGFETLEKSRTGNTLWAGSETGKIYIYHDLVSTNVFQTGEDNFSIRVMPNPSSQAFTILCPQNKIYDLSITAPDGRQVANYKSISGFFRFGESMQTGNYLVSVFDGCKRIFQQKIVKVK